MIKDNEINRQNGHTKGSKWSAYKEKVSNVSKNGKLRIKRKL